MKIIEWKLENEIKTREELMGYMEAAAEEGDWDFFLSACREVLEIARKKGWTKKHKCRIVTRK